MQASGRRVGGYALVASAVVLTAASILSSTMSTSLDAYREAGMPVLGAWLFALSGLLWLAGAVVLARQFNGTAAEGLATLGWAGALCGGVGLFLTGAIGVYGLTGVASGTLFDHPEEAFTALNYTSFAIGLMGIAFYYAGVAFFGLAMARTPGWPAWLAWSGVGIGAVVVLLHLTGFNLSRGAGIAMAFMMLGLIWVAVTGWILAGRGTAAAAPAAPQHAHAHAG